MSVALIINDGNWYSNALHNQLTSTQPQFRSLDYSIVQQLAFIQDDNGIKFVLSLKTDGFLELLIFCARAQANLRS